MSTSAGRSPTSCSTRRSRVRCTCTRCARRPTTRGRRWSRGSSSSAAHAGIEPRQVDAVFHGTTVATNAVLEHRGAKAGMLTTRGFRDIVHIGRHQRPQHYSIMQDIPWQARPFVKRRYRKVVSERIAPPTGDVLEALNEDEVRAAARALEGGRRRVGRDLLPLLVSQPGPRAARRRDRRGGDARCVRHVERRHLSAVPRVRALHDRVHERVRRPVDRPLPRAARGRPRRRGRAREAARDDVERRRRLGRDGGAEARDAAPLGTGGGRARRSSGPARRRAASS